MDTVYHNFDEDAIYFTETNKLLNKIMRAVAYLAKKDAMAKKEATSGSFIKTIAKNDDESRTNVKSDPDIVETEKDDDKSPQKIDEPMVLVETNSPKIIVVIIGYVTKVEEEISCPKTVSPSLVAVPNDTILFADEDPNRDNEMNDYFSDFYLEGKGPYQFSTVENHLEDNVVFNGGGIDRDLIFYLFRKRADILYVYL